MYNVRFIFPCDFEVNSRKKKRNKLAILGFSQNTDEEKTDEHQKGISTPVYNFLSPSISINDPNDIRWERDLYKEEVEIIVKDIYNSCFIKSDKFNLEGYAISEILYPYAIGLTKQFSKIEEVYSTISNIEKTFQYFNPINNTRKSIQPEWLIYSKPIVLVECDTSVGLPDFISDFSIQNVVLSAQLKTKNETIFYTSDAPVDAINKSIVLLAAMKYTSSYVDLG